MTAIIINNYCLKRTDIKEQHRPITRKWEEYTTRIKYLVDLIHHLLKGEENSVGWSKLWEVWEKNNETTGNGYKK